MQKIMMKKIIISGEIGWEVTAQKVREQFDAAAGSDVDVHLASPGGIVTTGLEIYNIIRDYKRTYPDAQMMLTIKGDAMSMASYIAVNPAWDLVAAEDNAVFMIHNAWGGAVGDYRDMSKMAEILDGMTGIIGNAYAARTGKAIKKIRELMDDETWYFGEEIKSAGFVDEIIKTDYDKNKASYMTESKIKFSALAQHLSEPTAKIDIQKIAALLKPASEVETSITSKQPATTTRDNNYQEDSMNLEQLLNENPAAKIEYKAALAAERQAGIKEGIDSMQKVFSAAGKYLKPDCAYPAPIKSLAVDVLDGKKSVESLETTVSAFDALKESQNSQNAAAESAALGDTKGQQEQILSQNGEMKTAADVQAAIKRDRAALGMEA